MSTPLFRPEGAPVWRTTRHLLALDRVRIMGIVNATPDSFSDGGRDPAASPCSFAA